MRKPKIGDIVHFCFAKNHICAAILIAEEEGVWKLHLFSVHGNQRKNAAFSKSYTPGYWSWPEEEKRSINNCEHSANYIKIMRECSACGLIREEENHKECAHEYIAEYWATANKPKSGYEICRKCKQGREAIEKPKECEHDFNLTGFTNHYDYKKCKKCGYKEENPQYKAEELIEKIRRLYKGVFHYEDDFDDASYNVFGREVEKLIKEYKGIP